MNSSEMAINERKQYDEERAPKQGWLERVNMKKRRKEEKESSQSSQRNKTEQLSTIARQRKDFCSATYGIYIYSTL